VGQFPHLSTDGDFFATYGIPLVAGRLFAPEGQDSLGATAAEYVLSETAARRFGWTPEEAVGQSLESGLNGNFMPGTVIGVVADTEFESIRDEQRPVLYVQPDTALYPNTMLHVTLRLTGISVAETLAFVDASWNRLMPAMPIQRRFVEVDLDNMYLLELKLGQLFTVVSALTVAIACMGLFGLAAFNTESRTKEIGVRKVLGSSVWAVVVLVAAQFNRLVLVANLVAWPLAWYAMNLWLQQYAVRIPLTPLIFIGSGAIALSIAWVTVGGVAAKAASRKPVLALRYE
jgi:putative ABC transport system permease protein